MSRIYLDHLSGTYVNPEVVKVLSDFHLDSKANPGSKHSDAIQIKKALEFALKNVIQFLGGDEQGRIHCLPDGYILCRLATTALGHAVGKEGKHIVLSCIEQPGIMDAVEFLCGHGFTCTHVGVDKQGRVDPGEYEKAIQSDTNLMITHHVNLDLGTIQPVDEIAQIAREKGLSLYVDAEGSAGWLSLQATRWNAAMVTASINRFHGPKGSGILYCSEDISLSKSVFEGLGPRLFSDTPHDPASLIAAGTAVMISLNTLQTSYLHVSELQWRFWRKVQQSIPYSVLNGPFPGPNRVPNNLNLGFEFLEGEGVMLAMDMRGIAIGAGAACVTQSTKIPPALKAIGQDPALAKGNVLVSFSDKNTIEEVDRAVAELVRQVEKLREMSLSWEHFRDGLIPSVLEPEKGTH